MFLGDFDDIFVLGFYIITTLLELYFLWSISETLKNMLDNRKDR